MRPLFVRPPLTGGVHRILSNPMNEDAEPRGAAARPGGAYRSLGSVIDL